MSEQNNQETHRPRESTAKTGWTRKEDAKLREAVAKARGGTLDWGKISSEFKQPYRSPVNCRGRWYTALLEQYPELRRQKRKRWSNLVVASDVHNVQPNDASEPVVRAPTSTSGDGAGPSSELIAKSKEDKMTELTLRIGGVSDDDGKEQTSTLSNAADDDKMKELKLN